MKTIPIQAKRPYLLHLGENLWEEVSSLLDASKSWAICCDSTLPSLYGEALQKKMQSKKIKTALLSLPFTEENKTRETKQQLEDRLFSLALQKQDALLALGGGVTTDIVGFTAATYLRGMEYVSMPTSLLAMVDACIGGKTGVNTPFGKNLIGTIYSPSLVFIDVSFLATLSWQHMQEGMAEVVKHAILQDISFLQELLFLKEEIREKKTTTLLYLIEKSCRIKQKIIEEDELEKGKRYFLNFGHTIGHALEKLFNYQLSHGIAISWGMALETFISWQEKKCSQEEYEIVLSLLNTYGLLPPLPSFSLEGLFSSLLYDKKATKEGIGLVLLYEVGKKQRLHFFSPTQLQPYMETFFHQKKICLC